MTDVYLNEQYRGTVDDAVAFIENFKDLRRKGSLPEDVNIFYDDVFVVD